MAQCKETIKFVGSLSGKTRTYQCPYEANEGEDFCKRHTTKKKQPLPQQNGPDNAA